MPARVSWHSLWCFVRHLGADSATYGAMYPKAAGWTREAYLMADIFDAVNGVAYAVAKTVPGGHPHKPRPYPRPKVRRGVKMGHGAIKVEDFDSWWERRVRGNGKQ